MMLNVRYLFGWTQPPKHAMIKWLKDHFVPPEVLDNFVCQDFGVKIEKLEPMMAKVRLTFSKKTI